MVGAEERVLEGGPAAEGAGAVRGGALGVAGVSAGWSMTGESGAGQVEMRDKLVVRPECMQGGVIHLHGEDMAGCAAGSCTGVWCTCV